MKIKALWNTKAGPVDVFILGFLYTNGLGSVAICQYHDSLTSVPIYEITIPDESESK